jgi:hypothetical protein
VPGPMAQALLDELASAEDSGPGVSASLFEPSCAAVVRLMELDSFPRFKATEAFEELVLRSERYFSSSGRPIPALMSDDFPSPVA